MLTTVVWVMNAAADVLVSATQGDGTHSLGDNITGLVFREGGTGASGFVEVMKECILFIVFA